MRFFFVLFMKVSRVSVECLFSPVCWANTVKETLKHPNENHICFHGFTINETVDTRTNSPLTAVTAEKQPSTVPRQQQLPFFVPRQQGKPTALSRSNVPQGSGRLVYPLGILWGRTARCQGADAAA